MGESEASLQCYNRMLKSGCVPNATTFSPTLKACAIMAAKAADEEVQFTEGVPSLWLVTGKSIYAQARAAGLQSDLSVANTAVDLFFKCGSPGDARRVFDEIPERSVVSRNTLILGMRDAKMGMQMFLRMKESQSGLKPDAVTYVAALKACGNFRSGDRQDNSHGNRKCWAALIAFYGRFEAREVFDSLNPARRDSAIWNAVLAGCSQIWDDCFQKMQQDDHVHPDGLTFLELLTALSRAGFVEKGRECLEKMSKRGPEHYACMVELMGRAGNAFSLKSLA